MHGASTRLDIPSVLIESRTRGPADAALVAQPRWSRATWR